MKASRDEDDLVCRELGGIFSVPEAHLSEPVTVTPRCISGKGAVIPLKRGGVVFLTLLHSLSPY